MSSTMKNHLWLGVIALELSFGALTSASTQANAALKWHKGTPSILSGKHYRTKRSTQLAVNGTHYEWVKGTKSTFRYYGFQWEGLESKSTSYKKLGHTYLIRGTSTNGFNKGRYSYLKIKQITAKKIRITTGTDIEGTTKQAFGIYYTMTRF